MPPSFGYLISLAKSIIINNNWVAVAGVARGQVPSINGLYTASRLSNSLANAYQPRNGKTSINPITNIKPYGLTIWGNRTMKNNLTTANGGEDGLTATSFLNIRNMVSDVKKTAYVAAKTLMFEQNSDVLWVNFLSKVTPLLDKLMSGQGLSDYKIIKNPTNEKAKLKATIKLFPIYAVEEFEITIELSDEDVSVV
jgi:phage tail sheath protein FI